LTEVDKFPKPQNDFKNGKIPKHDEWTVESLVGKRITEFWKSGNKKNQWFSGTVVGCTNNLNKSLIYYDERTIGVDPAVDYYAEALLSDKRLKWKLISQKTGRVALKAKCLFNFKFSFIEHLILENHVFQE